MHRFGIRQVRPVCGFSLLEIIVSLVVVALLTGLLVFKFSGMRENMHNTQCVSNLRALVRAGLMYSMDNDGYLPQRTRWTYGNDALRSLLPYMGLPTRQGNDPIVYEDSVVTCPSIQASSFRVQDNKTEWNRTYSINQYATGGEYESAAQGDSEQWQNHVLARGVPVKVAFVDEPSLQAFFMDGTAVQESDGYRYSAYAAPDRLEEATPGGHSGWLTPYIHNGGINVVFIDGHVRWFSREETEDLIGPTNPSASQAHTSPRTKPFWGARK